jgi:hypothetical protein
VFGIDVDGTNQPLFPKFAFMFQDPFNLEDAEMGNFHHGSFAQLWTRVWARVGEFVLLWW